MKATALLFAATISLASAQLPQMSDATEWLGYFVGWEGRNADFGIGSDGEAVLLPKDDRERIGHKDVDVHYLVEEKIKGRWVRRKFLKEGGLVSDNEKGLDPEKPVVLVTTVTGGTKVEWTHLVDDGEISIMPKLLAKPTANEIRVGVEFALPRLYRFDETPDDRDLRRKVGDDYLKAVRLKDGKRIKVDFDDVEEDLGSEEYLAEGAGEVEVQSKAMREVSLMIKNGKDEAGRIDIQQRGPLYKSFRMTWMANPEKIGRKDCFVTFWVE